MENAAKALLIAAGVLIAILLLTLFSYLFGQMAESSSKFYSMMEEHEIAEFNQQFLNYDRRDDLNIQDVATIVNLAINNNEEKKYNTTIKVTVENIDWTNIYNKPNKKSEQILVDKIEDVKNKTTYKCTVNVNEDTLLVDKIEITKN